MKFIKQERIEKSINKNGIQKTLALYGRFRVAPGFTVADYIKIGLFYGGYGNRIGTTKIEGGKYG